VLRDNAVLNLEDVNGAFLAVVVGIEEDEETEVTIEFGLAILRSPGEGKRNHLE